MNFGNLGQSTVAEHSREPLQLGKYQSLDSLLYKMHKLPFHNWKFYAMHIVMAHKILASYYYKIAHSMLVTACIFEDVPFFHPKEN